MFLPAVELLLQLPRAESAIPSRETAASSLRSFPLGRGQTQVLGITPLEVPLADVWRFDCVVFGGEPGQVFRVGQWIERLLLPADQGGEQA
jgi:hypothetical protein